MTNTDDSARRSRLLGVKLRALVTDHVDGDVGEPAEFAPGAALIAGDDAWVFLDRQPAERLGASIAWMRRNGARALRLVADDAVPVLARRGGEFDLPVSVYRSDDRSLTPVEPEPAAVPAPAPEHHHEFRALIIEGGAEPVVEHGVLAGEVRGLEVCRVVDDPATGATRLEVGVGEHDREAFQMLHGDVPAVESLARVVESVAQHRDVDAPPHPLKSLGAERLLRWRLEQQPDLVGAAVLAPAPPPVPRLNLKDATPCVATGVGVGGETVVAVCSSGVDLDVIPYAADARLALSTSDGADVRLVVVLPSRDRLPLVDEMAGLLRDPATVVSLD